MKWTPSRASLTAASTSASTSTSTSTSTSRLRDSIVVGGGGDERARGDHARRWWRRAHVDVDVDDGARRARCQDGERDR